MIEVTVSSSRIINRRECIEKLSGPTILSSARNMIGLYVVVQGSIKTFSWLAFF